MKKKFLHNSFALLFLVILQLPSIVQFEHSFHDHEDIHSCNAEGSDRHIHSIADDSCLVLHKIVNPNLQLFVSAYLTKYSFFQSNDSCLQEIIASKQQLPFACLRAPPTYS